MGMAGFAWSFTSVRTLGEMRAMMVAKALPASVSAYADTGYRGAYNGYEDPRNFSRRYVNDTAGNHLYLRDKTNVNADWQQYQATGLFGSACYSGDLYSHGIDENVCFDKPLDEKTLQRSINIAALPGAALKNRDDGVSINTFIPLPVLFTYDPDGSMLRVFPQELNAAEKYNKAISHHTHPVSDPKNPVLENMYFAFVQIPWDNFSDKELFSRIYMDGTTPLEYTNNVRGGSIPTTDAARKLPSGYLFRSHYAAVIDYEKA
jgi:hypothetical protein